MQINHTSNFQSESRGQKIIFDKILSWSKHCNWNLKQNLKKFGDWRMAMVKATCCSSVRPTWVWFYGGLNENGVHRLISLNMWSLNGTVWEGLGDVSRGRFQKPLLSPSNLQIKMWIQPFLLSCLCSTIHGMFMRHTYIGGNQQFSNWTGHYTWYCEPSQLLRG